MDELLAQITSAFVLPNLGDKCSILTNFDLKIEKPGPKVSSQDDRLYREDRFPLGLIECPTNRCAVKWLRPPLKHLTEMHIVTAEWGSMLLLVTNQAVWPDLLIPGRSIIDKRMVL
jgi:hypothetical protein